MGPKGDKGKTTYGAEGAQGDAPDVEARGGLAGRLDRDPGGRADPVEDLERPEVEAEAAREGPFVVFQTLDDFLMNRVSLFQARGGFSQSGLQVPRPARLSGQLAAIASLCFLQVPAASAGLFDR